MSFLKLLPIAFFLSILLMMEMPFNATPPANAQPRRENCILFALAGATRIPQPVVSDITGFMDGPALPEERVTEGLRILGYGTRLPQTFPTRAALENYLRLNDNAEYIVGWQFPPESNRLGHVVNARVNDRTIRYIDNQNLCESPNPAAEPPTNGPNTYYAWLTAGRQFGMADLGILFGGLSLSESNAGNISTLVKRDEIPPVLRNPNFGNFTETCRDMTLFTNFNRSRQVSLSAECKNEQGTFQPTAIILDQFIVNNSGALSWQSGGGFGGSVQNCRINVDIYTVLTCEAGDGSGSFRKAAINLDTEIANRNGRLTANI